MARAHEIANAIGGDGQQFTFPQRDGSTCTLDDVLSAAQGKRRQVAGHPDETAWVWPDGSAINVGTAWDVVAADCETQHCWEGAGACQCRHSDE